MMARSSGFGVLMISVQEQAPGQLMRVHGGLHSNPSYLLHPAFWECPGVFLLSQTPG